MKKAIVAVLMMALTFGVVGCGSTPEPAAPAETTGEAAETEEATPEEGATSDVELTLAWSGTGQDKEKFDALVAKYTEETGVKINTVFIPGAWSEYFTKIQSMIGGGEQVDVAFVAIEGFRMMQDMGVAHPLNPYMEANAEEVDPVLANLEPALLDALTLEDGNTYVIPTECNNIVIHGNKTTFANAGVDLPSPDWTKDDFLEAAKAMTFEEDGVKHYGFAVPQYYFMMEGWLRNNGSSFMEDDLSAPRINSPENVETIQFLQDLIYVHEVAPIPEPNVDPIQQIMDGTVAMGSFGRWPTLSYEANDFKDAFITNVPAFTTQQTMFGLGGVAVTSDVNYDEAAKFALWCAQDEFVKGYLTAGGIPANKAIADELIPTEYDPENSEMFYTSLSGAVPVGAPAEYAEVDTIVASALSEIFMNQADVQATLDAAQEQAAAAMQ